MDYTSNIIQPEPDQFPAAMVSENRWVCWRSIIRSGKPTKCPVNPNTGKAASSTDSKTWSNFETACRAWREGGVAGIGFMLGEGFTGIDLDAHVAADGELSSMAQYIVGSMQSYSELSPSGTGLHIIVRATLSKAHVDHERGIEIYPHKRYFCCTGHRLPDTPVAVESRQKELDRLVAELFPKRRGPIDAKSTRPMPNSSPDIIDRARRYLARMPNTECGTQSCHDKTIKVSCVLISGFALDIPQALPLLREWCDRGQHKWSERELVHKLTSSLQLDGERGWLLSSSPRIASQKSAPPMAHIPDDNEVSTDDDNARTNAGDIPIDCLEPPGLLGDIVRHNLSTSMYPQPLFALAGALALLATITGRKITDQFSTRPNCYIVSLGPTGCGKDRARKLNEEILLHSGGRKLLGAGSFASHAGLISHLAEQPSQLFQIDEIHRLLATLADPRKSPHLFHIMSVLLKLYSSSGSIFKADAYADTKRVSDIDQPNCVVYGTGLVDAFWQSLSADSLQNGLVGRLIVFEAGYVGFQTVSKPSALPDSLVRKVKAWNGLRAAPEDAVMQHPVPDVLPHSGEALDRIVSHMRSISDRRQSENALRAALWSRSAERAAKLALLFAASRWTGEGDLPQIGLADMDRGIALSNWVARRLIAQGAAHIAENAWDASVKRILRLIKDDGPLTQTELTRRTQWLKARDRDTVIQQLIESAQIEAEILETGGRPVTRYSALRLKKAS